MHELQRQTAHPEDRKKTAAEKMQRFRYWSYLVTRTLYWPNLDEAHLQAQEVGGK